MPRQDRRIQPLTSLPQELTPEIFVQILNNKIEEINTSFSSLDLMESSIRGEDDFTPEFSNHVDMNGKRITNASPSQRDTDYVTRGELRKNGLYADHTGRIRTQRTIESRSGVITPPATAPEQAVTLGQLQELFKQIVPTGIILLWSGAIAAIPIGWHICDGTVGTPDLRDRFIVGAGTTYAVGGTGGQNTINIAHLHSADGTLATDSQGNHLHTADGTLAAANESAHTHSDGTYGTDSQGAHIHSADGTLATATPSATTLVDNDLALSTVAVASATHTHDVEGDTSSNGAHTHDVTGASGAGSAHGHDVTGDTSTTGAHTHDVTGDTNSQLSATQDIRPLYYALAYIMKV